jgi:hypothetical protein
MGKVTSLNCPRTRTPAVPALRLVVTGVAGDPDDVEGFWYILEHSCTPSMDMPA